MRDYYDLNDPPERSLEPPEDVVAEREECEGCTCVFCGEGLYEDEEVLYAQTGYDEHHFYYHERCFRDRFQSQAERDIAYRLLDELGYEIEELE